jgi:hypothetical protein
VVEKVSTTEVGTTYVAEVHREGKAWVGEVPALDGATTWHPKSLRGLRRSLAEVIVLVEDLPDEAIDDIESRIVFRLAGDDADAQLVSETQRKRTAAAAARAEAEAATITAVRQLHGRQISDRDIAVLTGLSHQRVSQIASQT